MHECRLENRDNYYETLVKWWIMWDFPVLEITSLPQRIFVVSAEGVDLYAPIDAELQKYGEKLMQNQRGCIVALTLHESIIGCTSHAMDKMRNTSNSSLFVVGTGSS